MFSSVAVGSIASRWHDTWNTTVPANTTPTSSVALSGGSNLSTPTLTGNYTTGFVTGFESQTAINTMGSIIIVDRLVHQTGISGTTGTQTSNLPTVPLPRYTDGKGVMMALRIYTQVGTAATDVTVSYTNQNGTAGRTSKIAIVGGTNNREAGRLILLSLQEGDTGVRSVQSVTLTVTTGTAGNMGIILFKPLAIVPMNSSYEPIRANFINGGLIGNIPQFHNNACLCLFANVSVGSVSLLGVLKQSQVDGDAY